MKYAIIADIHGNYPAMRLAVDDAVARGAEAFLFVGDYCVSAPWPREVVEMLMDMKNAYIIRGNEEQYLTVPDGEDVQFDISRFCKRALSEEQRQWILERPEKMDMKCQGVELHMNHNSNAFIEELEMKYAATSKIAMLYPKGTTREEILKYVRTSLQADERFEELIDKLPKGVYIFGHTHVQWHMEKEGRIFINPGSCGLPLDSEVFGAPYTLLTIEEGKISVEEHRVPYEAKELIKLVKKTAQYTQVEIWSEVIFREWMTCREKVFFFLKFVEEYASKIGDERRPFMEDTWAAAYNQWKNDKTYEP